MTAQTPQAPTVVDGPFFDDLSVGDVFSTAPAMTLTSGLAAAHQAILGERLRLPLDDTLAAEVCGQPSLASPALVWNTAIGQSTVVTRQVVANLFYRGLVLHRAPAIGDTLRTVTEVVGLRGNRPKPGRAPSGMAALRMHCVDQHGRAVLDFVRCAMLPARTAQAAAARTDDLDTVGADATDAAYAAAVAGFDLDRFRQAAPGPHFRDLHVGQEWRITGGDVVSSAPELARLTLNIAAVHHDAAAAGPTGRLVYGGHTIGLALAQATRALPNLVTVAGWQECQHTGPVHEGDTLYSTLQVQRLEELPGGGGLAHLRSRVQAVAVGESSARDVLDWRFVGVFA
ncbi:Acyl dehydratase [Sinosporangium album]|uniref:Acyl dehydratase n=1 Tax=Sinosporangium album TaxID=504805 RepID=A0A1G8FQC6_9ACTN|nr:MaoC family dehydratase [Sinosporangium album]SDH84294.1 Acyl dehydratase [Sinosporangium album]